MCSLQGLADTQLWWKDRATIWEIEWVGGGHVFCDNTVFCSLSAFTVWKCWPVSAAVSRAERRVICVHLWVQAITSLSCWTPREAGDPDCSQRQEFGGGDRNPRHLVGFSTPRSYFPEHSVWGWKRKLFSFSDQQPGKTACNGSCSIK